MPDSVAKEHTSDDVNKKAKVMKEVKHREYLLNTRALHAREEAVTTHAGVALNVRRPFKWGALAVVPRRMRMGRPDSSPEDIVSRGQDTRDRSWNGQLRAELAEHAVASNWRNAAFPRWEPRAQAVAWRTCPWQVYRGHHDGLLSRRKLKFACRGS